MENRKGFVMVSRRKCVLLSIVSISVLWLVSSLLFFHRLSDDHSPVLLNSVPAPKHDSNAAKNADIYSAALAVNSAALKIAALEKENLELKRKFNSQKGIEDGNQAPSNAAPPMQLQVPNTRDDESFRAAFDKFEAFVLKPSEDKIPGMCHSATRKRTQMQTRAFSPTRPSDRIRNEQSA